MRIFVLIATVCWLFDNTVAAQELADAEIAKKIDNYAAPLVEAGHLSGTLLVARGDQVIYEKSWGFANREKGIPFNTQTSSCIASVSKPTTVILACRLIDDGKINLSDPISKWLQDFPKGEKIQFQHLLYHRSGIPHRLTAADDETALRSAADMAELARNCEFDFEPGRRYQYSSGGYSVLVRVLELASGQSYEQQLRETIFGPLELSDTFHPGPETALADKNAAISYVWTIAGQQPAPTMDYSFLIGAGSLFSTPRDMFAISNALVQGKFGERAKKHLLRLGKLRWNGITNNYRAYLEYDSKTDVTIAMVSNQMVGANDLLRQNVPRIVAGNTVNPATVPTPDIVPLPAEVLERYAGSYKIGGSPMDVRATGGALFANDWVLLPTSETTFYSPQDYATISIVSENGKVTGLDWSGMTCQRLGPIED